MFEYSVHARAVSFTMSTANPVLTYVGPIITQVLLRFTCECRQTSKDLPICGLLNIAVMRFQRCLENCVSIQTCWWFCITDLHVSVKDGIWTWKWEPSVASLLNSHFQLSPLILPLSLFSTWPGSWPWPACLFPLTSRGVLMTGSSCASLLEMTSCHIFRP